MFFKKEKNENVFLVCGLGNPEPKYEKTRHNAGFLAVDKLAENLKVSFNKKKFSAEITETKIGENRVVLAKPQTYMNNSGVSVGAIAKFYKIKNQNCIILCDDTSLPVGKIRVRAKGSAGGHNGLKSIIAALGGEDFTRVKIGVGEKPHPDYDMVDWVLGKIEKDLLPMYSTAIEKTALAAEEIIKNNIESAMNRFNA